MRPGEGIWGGDSAGESEGWTRVLSSFCYSYTTRMIASFAAPTRSVEALVPRTVLHQQLAITHLLGNRRQRLAITHLLGNRRQQLAITHLLGHRRQQLATTHLS